MIKVDYYLELVRHFESVRHSELLRHSELDSESSLGFRVKQKMTRNKKQIK
jgi:hypothetical protein